MKAATARELSSVESEVEFLGFALSDCVIEVDSQVARYMRAVHRTALELAISNRFGLEIGGFWLMPEQIAQLRNLPQCYSQLEAPLVQCAVEAYLEAQIPEIDQISTAEQGRVHYTKSEPGAERPGPFEKLYPCSNQND